MSRRQDESIEVDVLGVLGTASVAGEPRWMSALYISGQIARLCQIAGIGEPFTRPQISSALQRLRRKGHVVCDAGAWRLAEPTE